MGSETVKLIADFFTTVYDNANTNVPEYYRNINEALDICNVMLA